MSKELKRRGFRFTGPTTCYAFMQSAGLVDDHTVDCFRRTGRSSAQPRAARIFSTAAASASSPPPAALPTFSAISSTNDLYAFSSSGAFASRILTAAVSASIVPDSISCAEDFAPKPVPRSSTAPGSARFRPIGRPRDALRASPPP